MFGIKLRKAPRRSKWKAPSKKAGSTRNIMSKIEQWYSVYKAENKACTVPPAYKRKISLRKRKAAYMKFVVAGMIRYNKWCEQELKRRGIKIKRRSNETRI